MSLDNTYLFVFDTFDLCFRVLFNSLDLLFEGPDLGLHFLFKLHDFIFVLLDLFVPAAV